MTRRRIDANPASRLGGSVPRMLALSLALAIAAAAPCGADAGRRVQVPRAQMLTPATMAQILGRVGPAHEEEEELTPNFYEQPLWSPPARPQTSPPTDRIGSTRAQSTSAFGYLPSLSRSFVGQDQAGYVPADAQIASGPGDLVEAVNSTIDFFDKSGTNLYSTSLNAFMLLPFGWPVLFDPKVVYDETSQRFFLLALSRSTAAPYQAWFHLAVSMSSDPTTGWWVYPPMENDNGGRGVDYEELGLGDRGLYFTGNYLQFNGWPTPSQSHSNTFWAIDKAAMLTGASSPIWITDDSRGVNAAQVGAMKAVLMHGSPAGGPDGFITDLQPDNSVVHCLVWGIDLPADFPAHGPSLPLHWADTDNPGPMPNPTQAGGPGHVQANNLGSPPFNAVDRTGHIWESTGYPNGSLTEARVFDLDVSSWPSVSIRNQYDLYDNANFYFWPVVTANADGDAAVCFAWSGPTNYVAARWTEHLKDDGGLLSSSTLRAGDDYYGEDTDTGANLYRWGDYGGAAVDPANQGFWLCHMYAATRFAGPSPGRPHWMTWIGYVPRAVFVDAAYVGLSTGSRSRPWASVFLGQSDALPGNDLVIRAGSYPGAVTLDKPVNIIPDGGTVIIGP